jgi:GT2 family glycosyltransferase
MSIYPALTAVIVTHNSPPVLKRTVEALLNQSMPLNQIVIVDNGSTDPEVVKELARLNGRIAVIFQSNVGFAAANNLAMRRYADKTDYFLLVNPDAVLACDWVFGAHAYLDSPRGALAGIVSSPLRGMDVGTEQPTGFWDTLGIYRAPSGRWYDRGMRERVAERLAPSTPYQPTAICGALMFFSVTTYHAVISPHGFFDERFHTFKEDIELSLRVRRKGYRLIMLPELLAWHCRGWPKKRGDAPYWARKLSARNEVTIAARYSAIALPGSIIKYLYVAAVESWVMRFFTGVSK